MAITYNAGTNIITVTGYTAGTPCTFLDVYNADVAGGWGKVTRQCTNQFCFAAQLCIGDGSTATYLADNHIHAHWADIWTAHWQYTIRGRTNSHVTLTGCSISMVPSASNYAVSIGGGVISAEYAPDFNLIYCQITVEAASRPLYHYYTTGKIEHCILYNCLVSDTSNCDIKDVVVKNDYTAANGFLTLVGGTLDDIKIYSPPIAIYLGTSAPSATFKNLTCGDIATYDIQVINHSTSHYFINTVFQSTSWRLNQSSFTGAVYRQYEFDLKVIDKDNAAINGATVKIWDKDSSLIVDTTTNASGVIATQTITRGTYAQATGNTLQEKSPHLIKIEKAGYTTYEADFTLEDKTDWTIALQTSILRNPSMSGGMV